MNSNQHINTTFQQITDTLMVDGLSGFCLAIIEAGKPLIQEILIDRPNYYFNLKPKQFVSAITELAQQVADERGGEMLQQYFYKPSKLVNLLRRIFIRIYVQVQKGDAQIIDEIEKGNFA